MLPAPLPPEMAPTRSSLTPSDSSGMPRRQSRAGSFLSGPPRLFAANYYPTIQQTVVVDGALPATTEHRDEVKVRKRETIFGPDVGDDDQPGWTSQSDGNAVSVDVIKRWVDKARAEEGLHSTTTLQALVNLKRPSLLLHPLEQMAEADVTSAPVPPAQPLHQLKFNYDAMTPLVKITLTLHPAPSNKSGESVTTPTPEPLRVLYTGVHPGGFNQPFALPKESALNLDLAIVPHKPDEEAIEEEDDDKKLAVPARGSEDTSRTSGERGEPAAAPELEAIPELNRDQPSRSGSIRGRFGLFGRRQREPDLEAGQIEMTATADATTAMPDAEREKEAEEKKKKEEEEHGMRLVIQLDAVGAEGEPLQRRNGQLTHILVSGTWVPDAGSTHTSGTGKRVWVVKVVRREAQIGAHSFLLKEIYGLSSAASGESSSYPPSAADPYASAPNECIVCLTSPRDVVLLPCRHLVVCRECAVGMVEFGAGGRVARRDEEGAGAGGETPGPNGAPAAPVMGIGIGGGLAAPAAPAPAPTRRKKKAKGWYCPVCRQPYTSLLRLALPQAKDGSGHATPAAVEEPQLSRRGSIRSMRTARSTRSVATLPQGAEAMLSGLGPELSDDEDDMALDERHRNQHVHEPERPQFVIAETATAPIRTGTPQSAQAPHAPQPAPATATAPGPPVSVQAASTPRAPTPTQNASPTTPADQAGNGVANLRV